MANAVNLAVFAGDQPWSVLQTLAHWHRPDRPLRRLFVFRSPTAERPGQGTTGLVRFAREAFPELRVEVREGGWEPAGLRAHLDAWHRGDATAAWVLNLAGLPEAAAWAADPWIGRAGCQVLQKRPEGGWLELRRDPDGRVESAPFTEIRREGTDDLPLAALLKAFSGEDPDSVQALASESAPLPLVRLTEAAIRADWVWATAFEAAGVPTGGESEARLFQRYLAGFLASLGIRQVARTAAAGSGPALWVNHGGRILAIDAGAEPGAGGESGGPGGLLEPSLGRLAGLVRRWQGLPVEGLWFRPGRRATDVDRSVAEALGVRILDETESGEFPSLLARGLGVPLGTEGAEIERLLRHHLAASGRTRVLVPESSLLQQGAGNAGTDPVLANVDRWLEQVRNERRQNWQAWSHRGSLMVRVPAAGAGNPADDWRLLVSAVLRLGPEEVTGAASPAGVTLTLEDRPEVRQRLANWFRPFLNSNLTFVAARDRLAAEARAAAEAPSPRSPAPVAARSGPVSSTPPRRPSPPPAPQPAPAAAAPAPKKAAGNRPMRRVSLDDLDRALDDALGG